MTRTLEAIYENGVLRPLEDPGLSPNQRVVLELHDPGFQGSDSELEAWHQVYAGLSEDQVSEVERIALDRQHFSRTEP